MTRHLTLIAALTSALALTACDTGSEAPTTGNKADSSTAQGADEKTITQQNANQQDAETLDDSLDNAATLTLNGTLSAPDNISLPADAKIHVQLIDVTLEDGSAKVLTDKTFDASEVALPLPFSLKMPSDALNDDHRQVLQAEVRDGDDMVRWSTAEPEALALSADREPAPVALVLEAVETAPNEDLEADERAVSQAGQEATPAEQATPTETQTPEQA
ncbi:YbaY family lipoprotein [Halomonas sp. YLGW01]|uniref:YbaY family lipoprotein n=1 Tax=Halomonas sp. YLGW01 TaxID=2773308 RepID=UPI00177C76DE|nr:YbaY family lipoprotein [Halomonas sp. YLGW01]